LKLVLNIELIISILAILIAIGALIITIWQAREQRKYNRLSMRPILDIESNYSDSLDKIGLFLINRGTGPAIVTNTKFYIDNKQIQDKPNDIWKKILNSLDLINIGDYTVRYMFCGDSYSSNQKSWLLNIDAQNLTKDKITFFKEKIKRLKIEIDYESIYKEKCPKIIFDGSTVT